jgi:ribosomal protein S6--L-glutamate ligase
MRKHASETGLGIVTVRDHAYHPNRRLLEAAGRAGLRARLIHPYRVWPMATAARLELVGEHADRPPQIVLPRQGAEIGDACLALIYHFQRMGVVLVNDHGAVSTARNKFLSQQALASAGLPCPATVFVNDRSGFAPAVDRLGGYPVVVKPVSARQGQGVMRIQNADDAGHRVLAGLDRRRGILVQRYIAPHRRQDIRVLVIGDEAVCAVGLTPKNGEFRANFHLGSDIRTTDLSPDLTELALSAATAVGCDVAGVDLMIGKDGLPLIVEVNYAPGFKGLEAASGLDVAGRIVGFCIDRYMKK